MKKSVMCLVAVIAGSIIGNAGELLKAKHQDIKQQVLSNNLTGLDLYGKLKNRKGNIVISPYSIGTAMTMTLAGADGETRTEMAKVMHQAMGDKPMNTAVGDLHKKINTLAGKNFTLETANGLCLTLNSKLVSDSYKKLLKEDYYAELFTAANVDPVNAWVKKKTHDKIPKILNSLSAGSVCVLLNAVYFKGLWASQFKEKQTRNAWFYCEGAKKKKVPMMNQSAEFALLENHNYKALSMPFKGKKVNFIIAMPVKDKKLADLEKILDDKQMSLMIKNLKKCRPIEVNITIPRFKIEYSADLIDPFKALGMQKAFSAKLADFGKITGRKDALGLIRIAKIKHKAFLEINEEGGEASATTAVEMKLECVARPRTFKADKPFMFFITDTVTDSILFMGRVTNPIE